MKRKEGSIRGSVRECRIGVAVGIGLLFGIVCSLWFPHGFFFSGSGYSSSSSQTFSRKNSLVHPLPKENGLPCESTEKVKLLKSELNNVREEIEHLKKQEAELNSKLKISEQQKEAAQKQVLALGLSVKSGPVGTVKSLRTNPPVLPDESANPALAELLSKIAINKEVIVGISNNNVRGMLKVWFESIKKLGITNFLVVALDDPIAEFCRQNGVPVYRRDATVSAVQADTGANHAISGLKFHLLREFLVLGYGVLLSDVDIVYLQNPFHHLHRDCDVEAMSDGFTNQTAYGYDDVFDDQKMGWSRYAHTMRVFVFNSGFFYIRPTIPSIELLDRVTTRLSKEKAWDQAVFNEELYFPSRPGYDGLHASRRAMDFYLFMNSKVLFTIVRKSDIYANFKPVVIHVNYHPDKYERMLAIVDRYNGNKDALKRFPDGSEW